MAHTYGEDFDVVLHLKLGDSKDKVDPVAKYSESKSDRYSIGDRDSVDLRDDASMVSHRTTL